jgi:HD-like signal output (HDOD) protein
MNKRICFAGFSGAELSSLQTMTQADGLWECRFVPDAASALALLAGESHDVCVASLTLPGKNGAELLGEVGARHPKTLGFIVAEVADQAQIIKSIGGPHHFIRRPFAAAELVAAVQRGLKLNSWLAYDGLRQLQTRLPGLPVISATYTRVAQKVGSPGTTSHDIADVLEYDPLLSAELLQIVNTSGLSLDQRVIETADAVALLGLPAVQSLALAWPLFHPNDAVQAAGLSMEALWDHAFLVAQHARQITLKQTGNARLADDAYTAGLLHDVGRLLLAASQPEKYAAVLAAARQQARPLHEVETAQLGFNHAQAGACLLARWGMPTPIIEATAAHHAPGQAGSAGQFSLLTAVSAANVFAHVTRSPVNGLPPPELDLAYYRSLQLEAQLVVWRRLCTGELAMAAKIELAAEPITVKSAPAMKSPQTPARHTGPGLGPWLILFGALALLAAGYFAWPHLRSVAGSARHSLAHFSEPGSLNQHPTTPPPIANRWDTVKVDGIFYRTAKSTVIINDQELFVGDSISGFQVIAIHQNSVTISNNGVQRECPISAKN